jgi:hypothetical protein
MIKLICKFCKKQFKVSPSRKDKRICCSLECRNNYYKHFFKGNNNPFYGRHHSNITKEKIKNSTYHKTAKGANHPFYGKPSPLKGRNRPLEYSIKMREMMDKKFPKIIKRCLICNKEFKIKGYRENIAKYCSYECYHFSTRDKIGERSPSWKGGKVMSSGYIYIKSHTHPFRSKNNYVFEHRLVVEKQIGRYLEPKEKTHHINGIKNDNRPKNLMTFSIESAHQRFHKDPNRVNPSEIIFDGRLL